MLISASLIAAFASFSPVQESCASSTAAAASQSEGKTIVETALGNESFSTLVAALKAADLVGALQAKGPFTVFAPTNEAFANLPEGQLELLLKPENKKLLQSILTFHVAPGKLMANQVVKRSNATTVNGQRLDFSVGDSGVGVSGARITATDIECSNGVIHVIDSIIIPSSMDIVETAVSAGSFTTLAAALEAAKLVKALQGEGPFTLFGPTDEAFAKLPAGTVESLLKPENKDQLAAILTLHVVPGRVYSESVAKDNKFKTLQGQNLKSRVEKGAVFVNGARVLKADLQASNGVIHVIDTVLLPGK